MVINIDPVAFHIGSAGVSWYGIMVALAVITLVAWAFIAVRRGARLTYDEVVNAALVGIPSGIIGARLFHVLDYADYFWAHPAEIFTGFGQGLAIYGAVLGAALGLWIYSRVTHRSFAYLADVIAPGIILAQAIGRVGCTLNGCCYGDATDIFCAVTYVHGNQVVGPVQPTQIYEIVYNLIVFGVLLKLRDRLRPEGSLFMVYLTLYSAWRFGIDFIRPGRELFLGLHEAQLISVAVMVITLTLLIRKTRRVRKDETTTEESEDERV
jgi:phosphatidylglycerol:prolipoprotein diacylglycerol transferase